MAGDMGIITIMALQPACLSEASKEAAWVADLAASAVAAGALVAAGIPEDGKN